MANRLYNKQVSPKGYQKGGSVKQSPMGSSSTKGNILRGKLKSQKELKKITDSKKYKDASYGEKTKMLNVATMKKGGRVGKMGGGMMMQRPMMQEGGKTKKRGKDFMSTYIADDARKIGGRGGGADSGKAGEVRSKLGKQEIQMKKDIKKFGKKVKDIVTLKKFHDFANKRAIKALKEGKTNRGTAEPIGKRRVRRMGGGSLKAVQPNQKGLKKLPTEVRNKMGYMKKGGKVNGK